jgi:hypothetical protein
MLTDEQLEEMERKEGYTKYNYPRTIANFIRALQILEPLTDRDTHNIQGVHDEIFVYGEPPTSDEQQIELNRLGFRYDEDCSSWRIYT